jgi:hypothetical protein
MRRNRSTSTPAPQALLVAALDNAFDKRSWHGPNLTGALRGVSAADAARRVRGRKTIWEQALHAAYWKQRVLNKVAGPTRFARRGSDWPAPPAEPTEAAWRADVRLLHDLHRRLREAVTGLSVNGLVDDRTVWLIHGAAAHDVYHAGQIRLLRRLLAGVAARRTRRGPRGPRGTQGT